MKKHNICNRLCTKLDACQFHHLTNFPSMLNGFSNITILIRSKHFERMHAIRKFRGSPTSPPSGATRNGIRFGVDKAFKLRSFWRRPTDFLNIHVAVVGKIVGKLQDGSNFIWEKRTKLCDELRRTFSNIRATVWIKKLCREALWER